MIEVADMGRKNGWRVSFVVVVAAALLSSGCARQQYTWVGPSEGFAETRYRCLQETRSTYSQADVNAYYGHSQSGETINEPLFMACMEAKGYRLMSTQQATAMQPPAAQVNPTVQSSAYVERLWYKATAEYLGTYEAERARCGGPGTPSATFAPCMQSAGWSVIALSKGGTAGRAELEADTRKCRAQLAAPIYQADVLRCLEGMGWRRR